MNSYDSGSVAEALRFIAEQQPNLRDQFAMAIMGGFAANPSGLVISKAPKQCAEHAYKCADAMMEARDAKR